jgi:carbon starvation protein
MGLAPLAAITLAVLALGYFLYGRLVARQYRLDDAVPTPAVRVNDGRDYVPTRPFYLLGQHFSAIAAAGPIVGPIAACLQFGWLPCLLWIGLGVVFIGAVHDFSALVASVRHEGRSIAEIVRVNLGPRAGLAILLFIWLALIYVIVAFTDVTASTFVGKTEELADLKVTFNKGGAVAAASGMYLLLAIVMGLIQRFFNPRLLWMTLIFVPATLGVVWLGTRVSTWLELTSKHWGFMILVYCFVASLLPVWLLLQPRGYLGGFVLYMALAVGVVGIFFGGFDVQQPAFSGWVQRDAAGRPTPTGLLFPFLFVTIACGACSGFHGLVCSGTTSKQISKESHCRPVGYGGMLLEGFVALIALATVMIVAQGQVGGRKPGVLYGDGLAEFLAAVTGPSAETKRFYQTFGAMAFSTFVFDTLDVATRLGRYILQELFKFKGRAGAALATLLTVGPPVFFLATAQAGSYLQFWTLFGTSNQLLASLTLLALSVWLAKSGRRTWMTLLPMLFVMGITVWALALQILTGWRSIRAQGLGPRTEVVNAAVSVALMILAALLVVEGVRAAIRPPRQAVPASS